ncbi:MAG: ABC transporter ATP-binding protein [Treponema sp.]|jgi:peptide/nickel transport system ATP-binding protein|nr:ABC transporter ATP-binding protein [Treponema sp.]
MTAAEILLSVRGLKTYFYTPAGVVKAVDGLSFDVRKGETLGVIGESGCGKTAACLSVMRLIPDPPGRHEGGELFFQGRDILAMNDMELRSFRGGGVSMIFQEPMPALNPVLTVGHQIAEGILLHKGTDRAEARNRTLEWLDRTGFRHPERAAGSYPFTLSGGMRQRVMIAMALAAGPKLLIADEPAASLDMTTQAQILRLIGDLKRDAGLSCLCISHDPEAMRGFADRILVMYAGHPCEAGPAEELLARPLHPYTRGLMEAAFLRNAASPGLTDAAHVPLRLPVIPGHAPSLQDMLQGCPFHPRCSLAEESCRRDFPPPRKAGKDWEVWCWRYGAAENSNSFSAVGNTIRSEGRHDSNTTGNKAAGVENDLLIELRHIKKHFLLPGGFFRKTGDTVQAVDDVSLGIRRGSTLAVLGESGCGKTTLGRLAVKLLEPSSGVLFFDGRDITHVRGKEERHFRRRTQIVFQDPFSSLDPRMMVYDIIGEGLRNYRMVKNRRELRDRVVFAAEKCGLTGDQCALYPHQFSGGQRQRIAIARALAAEPAFIVCDEAVSALDVSVRAQIVNLLKDLQDEMNLTYLFMTHDLPAAEFMSRETAVMYLGRIVEKGPSAVVFHRPLHPYTRALLESVPASCGTPRHDWPRPAPPGEAPSRHLQQGCCYAPRCPRAGKECRREAPAYREAEPGHFISCFRS